MKTWTRSPSAASAARPAPSIAASIAVAPLHGTQVSIVSTAMPASHRRVAQVRAAEPVLRPGRCRSPCRRRRRAARRDVAERRARLPRLALAAGDAGEQHAGAARRRRASAGSASARRARRRGLRPSPAGSRSRPRWRSAASTAPRRPAPGRAPRRGRRPSAGKKIAWKRSCAARGRMRSVTSVRRPSRPSLPSTASRRSGPALDAGRPPTASSPRGVASRPRVEQLLDPAVAQRLLAGRAGHDPAAGGRELERLREVAERHAVRRQRRLDRRAGRAGAEARGQVAGRRSPAAPPAARARC